MEICAPVGIARLPKPFGSTGTSLFGPVWGLRSGERKRRHEISAAVDGDSLNIYSAKTGQIVFSYAVPPQTKFVAAPVSVRWVEDGTTFRQTCFAIKDESLHIRSVVSEESETGQKLKEASIELCDPSIVAHLDIVHTRQMMVIVVVQENGIVTIASANMKNVSSTNLQFNSHVGQTTLLTACSLSMQNAAKSILRSRTDITSQVSEGSIILAVFGVRTSQTISQPFYSTWSLRLSSDDFLNSHIFTGAEELFEHEIPIPDSTHVNSLRCSDAAFGAHASTLEIKTRNHYIRYKLSGSIPSILSRTQNSLTGYSDVLPMSQLNLIVSFPGSLQILDAKYEVSRATLELNKKKQPGASRSNDSMMFLAYFAQIRRAVARKGTGLVVIDLHFGTDSITKPLETSRLADSVGRGRPPASNGFLPRPLSLGFTKAPKHHAEAWLEQQAHLNHLVERRRFTKFERALLDLLRTHDKHSQQKSSDQVQNCNIPNPFLEVMVDYSLTKMFSAATTEDDTLEPTHSSSVLKLNFLAPRLIRWLASTGYLSLWRLKRALGTTTGRPVVNNLKPGDISKALFNAETSSDLLLTYLAHNTDLDIPEQMTTLKFLITLARTQNQPATQRLGDMQNDSDALIAYEATQDELEEGQMNSMSPPSALIRALVLALNRLGDQDYTALSISLRDTFSRTEDLIGLIQFLRQQLFQGRYASWLVSNVPIQPHKEAAGVATSVRQGDRASQLVTFASILKILSVCLDAVGPLQLLRQDEEEEGLVESIIPELLSEVELSARYIEESAELQGNLRETLRYSKSRDLGAERGLSKLRTRKAHELGEILTIYAKQDGNGAANALSGALPLSLRDDEIINPRRVRKGGGQVSGRSARQMRLLESRQKGLYSFERLIL